MLDTIECAIANDLIDRLDSQSIDTIITDPPYGLAGRIFDFPHKHYSAVNEDWDRDVPLSWLSKCERVLKPGGSVVCSCGRRSTYLIAAEALRLGWRLVNDITWFKPDAPPNFTGRMMTESTERILWFCPSGSNWTYNLPMAKLLNNGINFRDVWSLGVTKGDRLHPTQKPLALIEQCVRLLTRPGDIILDPSCGSGTTAIAARNTGRHFICGDSSPEYVAIARKRLQDTDPYQAT